MSIIDTIREAKVYRTSLITTLERRGLTDLESKSLDELELLKLLSEWKA